MIKQIAKRTITFCCTYYYLRKVRKHGINIRINHRSRFTSNTEIGNNCHFNGIEINGAGKVIFGDNCHIAKNTSILTSFHNYDSGRSLPYDATVVSRDVVIEDNVWIGQNVIVLAGVKIGEGAVIQAGSVVCRDIPPLAIAGGHPAEPFKYRDYDHYFTLKNARSFM